MSVIRPTLARDVAARDGLASLRRAPASPDANSAARNRAWRRFLLLWLAAPTLFRLGTLATVAAEITPGERLFPIAFKALLAGGVQDLAIALQLAIVILLAQRVLPQMIGKWLVPLMANVIFAVVQFYLLFDFLLFVKTGVRMDPAFLNFLPMASSFLSSAWELGLATLLGGTLGLLAVLLFTGRFLARNLPQLQLTRKLLWLTPGWIALAWLAQGWLPAELGYAVNNRLAADEFRWVGKLFRPVAPLSRTDATAGLQLLTPQAERFERIDPRYPLLKRTLGFDGPRQFSLNVAPDEKPHVVFLFLESFRARDIGTLGGQYAASPNFDRLAEQGVLFTNFYGNGVQTTRGVIASLFGVLPSFHRSSVQGENPDAPLVGLADLFNERGYTCAYISGNSLRFENKDEFFPAHGFGEVHGQRDVRQAYPHAEGSSWGVHDEYLVDYFVDWLRAKDAAGVPTFSTVFTITHHHPWHIPADYPAPRFPAANSEYRRFLQTFHYTDHCLGMLLEKLRQSGLDRKTIFFILADTATPQGEHHDNFMLVNYLYEENVRIPLLILAPGRIDEPRRIAEVGSQVDLLPTVMDLLQMQGVNHAVGTSLVRKVPQRTAYFNNPFALQYVGIRRGNWKYVYSVRGESAELFELSRDPLERNNRLAAVLRGKSSDPEATPRMVSELHHDAAAVNQFFLQLYMQEALARERGKPAR